LLIGGKGGGQHRGWHVAAHCAVLTAIVSALTIAIQLGWLMPLTVLGVTERARYRTSSRQE
jgi:hypothetical protein